MHIKLMSPAEEAPHTLARSVETRWHIMLTAVLLTASFLLAMLLSACAPSTATATLPPAETMAPTETGMPGETTMPGETSLPAAVALLAQQQMAAHLGVRAEDVEIISSEQVEWPDACLSLGGAAESCAQVVTPGWRVVVNVNGQPYEIHTDETGANIRVAP
jgi:hypothetical protein